MLSNFRLNQGEKLRRRRLKKRSGVVKAVAVQKDRNVGRSNVIQGPGASNDNEFQGPTYPRLECLPLTTYYQPFSMAASITWLRFATEVSRDMKREPMSRNPSLGID